MKHAFKINLLLPFGILNFSSFPENHEIVIQILPRGKMTTAISTGHDINEIFENLLLSEEIAEQSGFQEGYNDGKNQSLKGYHLGYHRGSELAAKLGYYSGIAQHCLNSSIYLPKVTEHAKKLLEAIELFPLTNDETVDIINKSEEIKFKFIKLCSLAKIDSTYPEADKLDF
ncbi:protein ORAOV1 homolog [Fopius arisanus]|uniref:Protein ORAOV1 homolog n=1 Tax=Fopius arisanus TaxID=64838 RepID=A0A9R1TQT1_9HYME|nr:PREDICTED: protein ORAOV1 homolog [Fopius arisanus]